MRCAFTVLLAGLALLTPAALFGSYAYYASDPLQSQANSMSLWTMNGSGSESSAGLNITASAGYISKVAVPDGSTNYEVAATLQLTASGGNYTLYLEASSNALLGSTSSGTFYAFDIENPVFANGGCSAEAALFKVVNGSVTRLAQSTVPCANSITYHAVETADGALRFYVNGFQYLSYLDAQPIYGVGGIGGSSMPAGNTISLAQLGPLDRVNPMPVSASSLQALEFANRVQLHAAGTTDDANGIGLRGYEWYRNGTYLQTTETPDWIDTTVSAATSYTYSVHSLDFHANSSTDTSLSVTTPSAVALDPRETGLRPTGSYWGGKGEQIDTRSGNLNFAVPLLKLKSRGWTVPLGLAYNSQNWENDNNGNTWQLGKDIGFGFGWTLQVGSLTPVYGDYFDVQFYEYRDASGAIYHLDQNNNGLWTSKESIYVTYDANAQRLHFNNGTFWVMGCQSGGDEADAGTLYPTLIEDSNGNQISLAYAAATGATALNSSGRLTAIEDTRPGGNATPTYSFTYNNDATPHLTAIANAIQSGDSFSFSYSGSVALGSPFGGSGTYGQASLLQSVTNNATSLTTAFTYDTSNAGELTEVTFPLGGHLRWQYQGAAYTQATVREVASRYLQWDATIGERSYTFYRNFGSSQDPPVAERDIVDAQGNAYKSWYFDKTAGPTLGLQLQYLEGAQSPSSNLRLTNYTWAQDPAGNNYVARLQITSDPGQSYAVTHQTDQTVDQYGNVTQTKLYDYADLTHPAKIYNTSYLTSANGMDYTSLYIRDRVASVTLTDKNGVTTTLRTNTYDQYPNGITPTNNIQMHDVADYGPSTTTRGNLYDAAVPWGSWHSNYDQTGTAVWTGNDINPNHYTSQITSAATNYAVPDRITTSNALNTDMTWSAALDPMTQIGANGDLSTVQYDASDRPQIKTSPYGAQTTYAYSVSAPQIVATTNNRWVKTYLDGLGRPAKIERGDSGGTQSVTEMVYDACGCNPIGKLYQRSVPHAPGATANWTVYTYDALGRRLTATRPDGHSTTTYSYAGNVVTITDPAGKWKQFTRDAFGEIVQVQEPSPHPGSEPTHVTSYAYDVFGHLILVTMPRTVNGTVVTQTRTWSYDPQTLRLFSKTSPEAGTVTYTYNGDNTLATVTDAKNQRVVYSYDQWGRVSQIARGTVTNGVFTEDASQRTTYAYEGTNGGYSSATQGRVSQITYSGPHGLSYTEWYSYHKGGVVVSKRLHVTGTPLGSSSADLDAAYTYDNEGHMTSAQYPNAQVNSDGTTVGGPKYNYSYDTMERLNGMTDANNNALVSGVSYNAANQMLQLNAATFTETRVYNVNQELMELTSGANVHYRYNYSATQDNGQMQSQSDVISGETISYQYDSLLRLVNAAGAGDPSGSWSEAYTYDGFGNLTQKTAGNAPALSIAVDPATNRILTNAAYDSNGNLTAYASDGYSYDIQNRMVQANPAGGGTVLYGYDSTNHRIYKGAYNGSTYSAEEIYFYGVDGHKYGTWQINPSSGVLLQMTVTKQWFGARLLSPEDHLGSRGKYYPYGEERTGVTPPNPTDDQEKFATYTRDSATNLDYAGQRYYDNLIGRFITPDPLSGSASVAIPQSWNRYAYVNGDPANNFDPNGTIDICSQDTDYAPVGGDASSDFPGCNGLNYTPPVVYDPTPTVVNVTDTTQNQGFFSTVVSAIGNAFNNLGATLTNGFTTAVTAHDASTLAQGGLQMGIGYAMLLPGPEGEGAEVAEALEPGIAATFTNGEYAATTLTEDMTAYRYSGGISGPFGRFLTNSETVSQISSPNAASIALNLPEGATAEALNQFTIPAGTTIYTGGVAGGADTALQIFIRDASVLIPQ